MSLSFIVKMELAVGIEPTMCFTTTDYKSVSLPFGVRQLIKNYSVSTLSFKVYYSITLSKPLKISSLTTGAVIQKIESRAVIIGKISKISPERYSNTQNCWSV